MQRSLSPKGEHPKVIQERFGHASIKTTLNTYGICSTVWMWPLRAVSTSSGAFLPWPQRERTVDADGFERARVSRGL